VIIFLLGVLGAAAALSRPSEASFKAWYEQHAPAAKKKGFLARLFGGGKSDSYLAKCAYKDHVLWADVERDGQVIYTGAFDHWVDRDQVVASIHEKIPQ